MKRLAVALFLLNMDCKPDAPAPTSTSEPHAKLPSGSTAASQGSSHVVAAKDEVKLTGPRVQARAGDFVLEADGLVAVVDAVMGRVVDFGFAGSSDGLVLVDPGVLETFDLLRAEVTSVVPTPDAAQVTIQKHIADKNLLVTAVVRIAGGRLEIETRAQNLGTSTILSSALGETVHFGNSPMFVEGHGPIVKGGAFGGRFVTASTPFADYAVCKANGSLMARFASADYAGDFKPFRSGEAFVELRPQQISDPRTVYLMVARDRTIDQAIARCFPNTQNIELPGDATAEAYAEIARCKPGTTDMPGDPYYATRLTPQRRTVALPDGCFVARLSRRAHAPSRWVRSPDLASATDIAPQAGRLSFRVQEGLAPVPCKLTLLPTAPEAKLVDLGIDAKDGVAQNAVYSLEGKGEVTVPPGEYDVLIGRGPEYDVVTKRVRIEANAAPTQIEAELRRVLPTERYVSADLHVHALPSADSPTRLDDRLRTLVAVDLDVFAATDHNKVTDYRPLIETLGLSQRIASIVGDEVTTYRTDFGHFNVFPLPPGSEPLPYENARPRDIVQAARSVGALVQLNHPRMGRIGTFELLRFDPRNARESLDRSPVLDSTFDAIEVFNGDDYSEWSAIEKVLADWYALLRAGVRVTATGNSDSHRASFQEAGVPRNWVRMTPRAPDQPLDEAAFVEAIRKGRVIVSSGPLIELTVNGAEVGDSVAAGDLEVSLRVSAAPWVDVTQVDLVQSGEIVHSWKQSAAQVRAATPHVEIAPFGTGVVRLQAKLARSARKGDFFVVVARGEQPMSSLSRPKARPFAFTNPVWVD